MKYAIFLSVYFISNIFVSTVSSSGGIPSYVPLCKMNDPELSQCIINTFNEIRPYLVKGIPEMNIPPGEPLKYINASTSTGKQAAVNMRSEAWNVATWGLTGAQIQKLNVNIDEAYFGITLFFPHLRMEGEYRIKGEIMLLKINAADRFNINATDVLAIAETTGKYYTKAGKRYIKFEKVDLDVEIENVTVYYNNLVAGNPGLTQTFNKVLNDNMPMVLEDLKPIINDIFGELALQYFNAPFQAIPVDKLFPLN